MRTVSFIFKVSALIKAISVHYVWSQMNSATIGYSVYERQDIVCCCFSRQKGNRFF